MFEAVVSVILWWFNLLTAITNDTYSDDNKNTATTAVIKTITKYIRTIHVLQ